MHVLSLPMNIFDKSKGLFEALKVLNKPSNVIRKLTLVYALT